MSVELVKSSYLVSATQMGYLIVHLGYLLFCPGFYLPSNIKQEKFYISNISCTNLGYFIQKNQGNFFLHFYVQLKSKLNKN